MSPRPARASDRQTKGFDHVCPVHHREGEAVTARNAVTTCVVLGGGRNRVPGVCREHRGIPALPGLRGAVPFLPDNAHVVVHGLHRRPADHASVVRLGVRLQGSSDGDARRPGFRCGRVAACSSSPTGSGCCSWPVRCRVSRLGLFPEQPARRCSICDRMAGLRRSSRARRPQVVKPSAQSALACWPSTLPRRLGWSGGCSSGLS